MPEDPGPIDAGENVPAKSSENPADYCPTCGTQLRESACKRKCPTCGFFLSCSDFY